MTRVLLTTDAVGGVWRYTLELAAGLAARGDTPVLAVMGPAPDAAQRAELAAMPDLRWRETNLPLDWTAPDRAVLGAAADSLCRLAREEAVDSVHLHAPALAVARYSVPVVVVAHSCVGSWWHAVRGGPLPGDLAWRADATRTGLLAADRVIAPSAAFAELLYAVYQPRRAIDVVHNGRRPMRLPKVTRTHRIFTAGRLWDEGKNIAMLDRAAGRAALPVMAAGGVEGPQGQAVALSHIEPLGVLNEADLARNLAACRGFASLARYEPFGLAVLEAAQAGLPLLLSDIPTFRELWDGAALFVPPDDEAAIVDGLHLLAERPELGRQARERAARYTVPAMVEATASIHHQLVHSARASGPVMAE